MLDVHLLPDCPLPDPGHLWRGGDGRRVRDALEAYEVIDGAPGLWVVTDPATGLVRWVSDRRGR